MRQRLVWGNKSRVGCTPDLPLDVRQVCMRLRNRLLHHAMGGGALLSVTCRALPYFYGAVLAASSGTKGPFPWRAQGSDSAQDAGSRVGR